MSKKKPESYWNYRVMATKHKHPLAKKDPKQFKDFISFGIHEVYYRKDKPDGYIEDKTFDGDSVKELKWTLNHMKEALRKPVLWAGKKFPKIYKP